MSNNNHNTTVLLAGTWDDLTTRRIERQLWDRGVNTLRVDLNEFERRTDVSKLQKAVEKADAVVVSIDGDFPRPPMFTVLAHAIHVNVPVVSLDRRPVFYPNISFILSDLHVTDWVDVADAVAELVPIG